MSLAVAASNASAMSHALLIQSFHRGGGRRRQDDLRSVPVREFLLLLPSATTTK